MFTILHERSVKMNLLWWRCWWSLLSKVAPSAISEFGITGGVRVALCQIDEILLYLQSVIVLFLSCTLHLFDSSLTGFCSYNQNMALTDYPFLYEIDYKMIKLTFFHSYLSTNIWNVLIQIVQTVINYKLVVKSKKKT